MVSPKLAITICATKSYTYAMLAQARRVAANVEAAGVAAGHVILVGDASRELKAVGKYYEAIMPAGWQITLIANPALKEDGPNYQRAAQLCIATMRSEAFAAARKCQTSQCWSLDSDVLPPANALRCMRQMLDFDAGYYSISSCPYPNTGFLGGFGSRQNPIAEDYLAAERIVPWKLRRALDACDHRLQAVKPPSPPPEKEIKRRQRLHEKLKACPPDGNIWEVIAKHGWRRRGWLENAYPAIGLGAVVPSDWCGFGCTLMGREALALAHFEGYDGRGTEDLFICWHRWHPAGLRLNVIPHCPCDHIIWEKKKGGDTGKYVHHVAYHEPEGEYRGHLRQRLMPWSPDTF